jgi:hypothetical protein
MLIAVRRAECIVLAAVLGVSHVLAAEPARAQPHQSQESFGAAIRNDSTSPSYVLITVVDDTTGQARTGCTSHVFHFSSRGTLQPTGPDSARDARACALIERGLSVRMADLTANLLLEP